MGKNKFESPRDVGPKENDDGTVGDSVAFSPSIVDNIFFRDGYYWTSCVRAFDEEETSSSTLGDILSTKR